MKLSIYANKKVHITLNDKGFGYFYKGQVYSYDDDSITLLDINDKMVTIQADTILTIREIE